MKSTGKIIAIPHLDPLRGRLLVHSQIHHKPIANPAQVQLAPSTVPSSALWHRTLTTKSPQSCGRLRGWRLIIVIVILLVSHNRKQTILGRVSARIPKGKRWKGEDLPDNGTGREGRPGCWQSDRESQAQQLTIPPKCEGDGCRPYGGHPGGGPRFAGSTNAAGCSAA